MSRRLMASIVLLGLAGLGEAQEEDVAGEVAEPFNYTRIYVDADGNSHFSTEPMSFSLVEFSPDLPPVSATNPMNVGNLVVLSAPAGGIADWHPVPRRQLNIMLAGKVEIEVSDGEVRRFGPGSFILGEDTAGTGHITRVVSDVDTYFAVISLPDS